MDDAGDRIPFRKESVKRDLVLGEINPGMFHEINHPTYAKGMNLSDPHLSLFTAISQDSRPC